MSKNYTTNILDLGGKVTGNVSGTFTMVITPKPGYVVRKGDFTAVEDPDVNTIAIGTLTQTSTDYAVGNTVGIPITLTNFQMPAADTKIKIDITGNAKLASTIPQTSNISFTIINNLVTSTGQGVTITSATGSNGFTPSSGTPGTGNVSFSGNLTQGEDSTSINEEELLEIGQIIVTATATSVTISGIQTDGDEQSADVLSGAISSVSPGDIVTGQNVPSGTTVVEIEPIPGGSNSQIIFSNNMPSQTVDLTFTSDQELGDDPEIGDGPRPSDGDNRVAGDDNFVRFEEVGRTLSASGKAKTITYKLFVEK
jgi:hypothetical protein